MTLGKLGRVRHPERVVRVWGRRCNFEGPTEVGWLVLGSAEEVRIGELLNRYLDRRARGESITEDLITAEHPDLAGELLLHLNMLKTIEPPELTIKQLVGKKILAPATSSDWSAELGPYRITGVIGRGGMGIVLRAHDPSLGRPVALKLLRPELAVDRRALVRFEHEAKAAAALRHPNIVTIHACGECDGSRYLAMELVDGPSLADLLAQGLELPTEEIRRIFHELLEGLTAAHSAGLIHRDIKSSNILLDGTDRRVKIADFGLARIATAQTRITMPQAAVGTPEYMSPEQARGDEDIDHRTDLYSAGVVLYEMLTGRVPFKADTASAVIHAILHVEPPEPASVRRGADPQLSRLALRLMAKEPEHRLASAAEILSALEQQSRVRLHWSKRARRRLLGAALVSMALIGACLARSVFIARAPEQSRPLESSLKDVKIWSPSGEKSTTLSARWGNELTYKEFYTFPGAIGYVTATQLVDPGPGHRLLTLAATHSPLDGHSLFAFHPGQRGDTQHEWFWSQGLLRPYDWPGQEVLLVVTDQNQYPSYLAMFDPRTLTIGAEYWHWGKFVDVLVAPEFLGPGRPAVIAIASNNKLDGFDPRQDGDPDPVANFNWVSVLMILELNTMNASRLISVPNAPQRMPGLATAMPYAYAFLNAAMGPSIHFVDLATGEIRSPSTADEDGEIMGFFNLSVVSCPRPAQSERCIQVSIGRQGEEPQRGAVLILDSDLAIRSFDPQASERVFRTPDPWMQRFRRLVVRGEFVE